MHKIYNKLHNHVIYVSVNSWIWKERGNLKSGVLHRTEVKKLKKWSEH